MAFAAMVRLHPQTIISNSHSGRWLAEPAAIEATRNHSTSQSVTAMLGQMYWHGAGWRR